MRIIRIWVMLPALMCGLGYLGYHVAVGKFRASPESESKKPVKGEPVVSNRGPEVQDGFRGAVHPLLHGQTRLAVTAQWSTIGEGQHDLAKYVTEHVYAMFRDLKPAKMQQTYGGRDFSALLPETVETVGQTWAIDLGRVALFLKQFHPEPRTHLGARGRRVGPDGGFAILRAMSPAHLDIVFRVHAEFQLAPEDPMSDVQGAWYTPAAFSGRMLLNRQTGTVDYFRMALPTELPLNVHLTMGVPGNRDIHEIVRVERMELIGGDGSLADHIHWTDAMSTSEAELKLKKVFYKFMEVDWVPFEKALTLAREKHKPMVAVILWGSIEDQSC